MPSCVCQYWQRHTGTWQNLFLGLPLNSTELRRKGLRFRWGGLRFRSGGLRSSVFGPLALPRPRWQQRRIIQRSRSKNTPALQANRHETWWYVRYIRIHSFIHSLKSKKKEKKENPNLQTTNLLRAELWSTGFKYEINWSTYELLLGLRMLDVERPPKRKKNFKEQVK